MLSLMAQEFFSQSPVLMFPIAALFLFMIAFSVLSLRAVLRPKEQIAELANMPLEADVGHSVAGEVSQ